MFRMRGFTFIEILIVIAVIGILAAAAIPKYVDLTTEANSAVEINTIAQINTGIDMYYANQCISVGCEYPNELDSAINALCDNSNPCFTNILEHNGMNDGSWTKVGTDEYTGPTGINYLYDSSTGSFTAT